MCNNCNYYSSEGKGILTVDSQAIPIAVKGRYLYTYIGTWIPIALKRKVSCLLGSQAIPIAVF